MQKKSYHIQKHHIVYSFYQKTVGYLSISVFYLLPDGKVNFNELFSKTVDVEDKLFCFCNFIVI